MVGCKDLFWLMFLSYVLLGPFLFVRTSMDRPPSAGRKSVLQRGGLTSVMTKLTPSYECVLNDVNGVYTEISVIVFCFKIVLLRLKCILDTGVYAFFFLLILTEIMVNK